MRIDDERESENVEDRRSQGSGGGRRFQAVVWAWQPLRSLPY